MNWEKTPTHPAVQFSTNYGAIWWIEEKWESEEDLNFTIVSSFVPDSSKIEFNVAWEGRWGRWV